MRIGRVRGESSRLNRRLSRVRLSPDSSISLAAADQRRFGQMRFDLTWPFAIGQGA